MASKFEKIQNIGFDFEELSRLATYQFSSEAELIQSVKELHHYYVHDRHHLAEQLFNDRLASAYLYLYFATNVPKLFKLLQYLPESLIKNLSHCSWIDFGSGPATYTLSWYIWLKQHHYELPPSALLIEKDPYMRKLAHNVLEEYLRDEHILIKPDFSDDFTKDNVLFFGFSLNELIMEDAQNLISKIHPKFIIFLEPGTKASFAQILNIRSHLFATGYKVHYPCTHQKVCPLKDHGENWCHQYLPLKFHPEIDRLNQLVSLNRKDSAILFHVYERTKELKKQDEEHRVVQGPHQSKGVWSWQICNSKGEVEEIETLMRHYSKEQKDLLENKIPGTTIEFTKEKNLKNNLSRVLVTKL